jgi:hypothetical protein
MAKFINIWRARPTAPWPTDPAEMVKLNEIMFEAIDSLIKAEKTIEFGYFADARSGYAIAEGDAKEAFERAFTFIPWIESEMHEIIPYETGKEAMRRVKKAQAEAMELMKRA